jgi:hypothetical protein
MLFGELEAKVKARGQARRRTRLVVKAWVVCGLLMVAVVLAVWARL